MTEFDAHRLQEIDGQPSIPEMRRHLAEDAATRRYNAEVLLAIMGVLEKPSAENDAPIFVTRQPA